jgi:CRP-like cAMP-binding protein
MTFDECFSVLAGEAGICQTFSANEFLFRRGDETTGLYVVIHGSVKMMRMGPSGKDAALYVARSGDPLAEASIFSPIYHCDAIALTDASVRFYPKAALMRQFERNHRFAESYLAMLGRQLMIARTRFERVCLHSARERVLHFLTLEVDAETHSVEIPGTLKEFASELGLTHEAFYRTLAQMAKDGEIERDGNVIKLLNASTADLAPELPSSSGRKPPRRK